MGRICRNRLSRGCYHVYNRGINAAWVLQHDADRDRFLGIFQRLAAKYSVSVYHYCIMSNHFHFALSGEMSEISALIGGVCSSYGKYWHGSHKNGYGPIWQGRFKCILVQKELYLNRLGRYIERNPLRAGIDGISRCEEYRWSSAGAYLTSAADPLVMPETHPYRSNWGSTPEECRQNYALYLNNDDQDDLMTFRSQKLCLGDDQFQSSFALKSGRPHLRPGRPSPKAKLAAVINTE